MTIQFELKSQAIDWIVDHLKNLYRWTHQDEFLSARKVLGPDLATEVMHTISQSDSEQARKKLREMQGKFALQENDAYFAQLAFVELNDKDGLRKTIEIGLQHRSEYDALLAYLHLKEPQYLKGLVDKIIERERTHLLETLVDRESNQELNSDFKKYCRSRRVKARAVFSRTDPINAAYNLAPEYDVAVGIARGGLTSSHIFHLMGLPVVLCEAHRRGRGATFKWHHPPKRLNGKRILVLEKDAVSGRSLRRTVREILPYNPKKLGVFFNHDPPHLNLDAVPREFEDIYHPEKMDFKNFYNAYMKCRNALAGKK